MAAERDKTATVPIMLRIREDLRQDLEESAKARRVSLNQEVIDRLTYVRDRKSLLAEVLRLSFGERLAGLLLVLGLAMANVASSARQRRVDDKDGSSPEWIDDPVIFNHAAQVAMMLIEAARPEGGEERRSRLDRLRAYEVIAAVGSKPHRPTGMLTLPARDVEAIKELLGPVAQRMTPALQVRDALVLRIASGEWKPNTRIPSERDLAREFGVTLETIRKALDFMEGAGLLTRRAGKATTERSQEKHVE